MKKLTRASLAELAKTKTMISFLEQRRYVGGGTGTQEDPFSYGEFMDYFQGRHWSGGWVQGVTNNDGILSYCGGTEDPIYVSPNTMYTGGTGPKANTIYDGGTGFHGYNEYNGGTNGSNGTNDYQRETETITTLRPNQFKGYKKSDEDGRLRRSDEMLATVGVSRSGQQINMTNNMGNGRAGTATEDAQKGIDAINSNLKAGKPIIVSVDYRNGRSVNDGQGDHFIVITGCTTHSDGTTTYSYYNSQTADQKHGTSAKNTLTVKDGRLVGTYKTLDGKTHNHVVTDIRLNK